MGKGGGRQQQTDQTVVQTNLPKYVEPYFKRLLERTEAESKREYTPYEGKRLADESERILNKANISFLKSLGWSPEVNLRKYITKNRRTN